MRNHNLNICHKNNDDTSRKRLAVERKMKILFLNSYQKRPKRNGNLLSQPQYSLLFLHGMTEIHNNMKEWVHFIQFMMWGAKLSTLLFQEIGWRTIPKCFNIDQYIKKKSYPSLWNQNASLQSSKLSCKTIKKISSFLWRTIIIKNSVRKPRKNPNPNWKAIMP